MTDKKMLVCDIDDTLLKDGRPTHGLGPLKTMIATHRDSFYLVYASGRSKDSIMKLIDGGILPEADALAPSIGTEIWLSPWRDESEIYRRWTVGIWDREKIEAIVGSLDGLKLQEPEFQTESKISFYMDGNFAYSKTQLEQKLDDWGLEVRLVYSCGQFLDVLPKGVGKRSAVNHLRDYWQVDGQDVIVCGDSGNDIDMIADPTVNSVVVSNAQPDLDDISMFSHVHRSKLRYAAGVLEGAYVNGLWSRFDRRLSIVPSFDSRSESTSARAVY